MGKRQTPNGGHTSSSGIPTKRQRVELTNPPGIFLDAARGKSTWFNEGVVKATGRVTAMSLSEPVLVGNEGNYDIYLTADPFLGFSPLKIKHHSGWYTTGDIIWKNYD